MFNLETREYTIKYREYDLVLNRDGPYLKTVTRTAATQKEATNKLLIQHPRSRIMSCTPEDEDL
jgi:hypothetical protein